MTLSAVLDEALGALGNGTAKRLFAWSFATGFGFGCGILASAELFNIIPGLGKL